MIDTCMSRSDSHAFASCSSPYHPQTGLERPIAHTRRQRMARPQYLASQRQTTVMASNKKGGGNFNPFRNKKKEDAAKKALEEMFGGQQDVLAAYDAGGGSSGKGGGRRGGGGGGGAGGDAEGGSFDFRQWMAKLAQSLGKTGRSLGKTALAVLLLLSIFYASNFIQPLMRATITALRWVLRLDGAGSRRARRQPAPVPAEGRATLGEHERSILAKYAQDDDEGQEEQQHHRPSRDQDEDDELD